MTAAEANIHVLDAAYKPFPTFAEWTSKTLVDTVRWDRYNASLASRSDLSPEVLRRAREIAKRAAALDTGAIEGLYEVDRGFTFTVAFETAAWEVELAKRGENVRPLFEAQLHAYDFVLDLATKAEPISEAAIRKLHEEVCRAQETYSVETSVGPQQQNLPKGQYKILPNHVRTRNATDHSYAPVDMAPAEMYRLVTELRGEAFLNAHPVLQAAYAHYGFVVIHPFADGNGRVARALASTFTYRAISMPIVILSEHKASYLDALEGADNGEFQLFVDFMLARSLDTISLVNESVLGALVPSADQSVSEIDNLYFTRGGYAQEQVDAAGGQMLQVLFGELADSISKSVGDNLSGQTTFLTGADDQLSKTSRPLAKLISNSLVNYFSGQTAPLINTDDQPSTAYRLPAAREKGLRVELKSRWPAEAKLYRIYTLRLPMDADSGDDIQLRLARTGNSLDGYRDIDGVAFSARMDELFPSIAGVLQIRATLFSQRVIGEMLDGMKTLAERSLRGETQKS